MNTYKVIIRKKAIETVEASDEEEAEEKALAIAGEYDVDCEVELIETDCYTDLQEQQDEEERYDRKYK